MEVQKPRPGDPAGANRQPKPAPGARGLDPAQVGQRLGEWQKAELRLARSFPECRGVGRAQMEDLYQDTMLVLLDRPYNDEQHLRNALRWGIKHRALHLHRDERRRGEILTARAPELQLVAEGRAEEHTPEQAAVLATGPADRLGVPVRADRARAAGVLALRRGHALPRDRAGARHPRERGPQSLPRMRAEAGPFPAALRHRPPVRIPLAHDRGHQGTRTGERGADAQRLRAPRVMRAMPCGAQNELTATTANIPRPGRGAAADPDPHRPSRMAGTQHQPGTDGAAPSHPLWPGTRRWRDAGTSRRDARDPEARPPRSPREPRASS